MNIDFEKYFESVFKERWSFLRSALQESPVNIMFSPRLANINSILNNPESFIFPEGKELMRSSDGFLDYYPLDLASLLPVLSLSIGNDQKICDMCASPGGKSLGILSLMGGNSELLLNDSSKDRFINLKKNISQYFNKDEKKIIFQNKDAQRFGFYYKDHFDRILLDAPCSSERHLIHSKKYLDLWTQKKAKFLAQKQYTLLCAAFLCLKKNGKLVYSTCSINPVENDQVIAKFLKKRGDFVRLEREIIFPDLISKRIESTEYGFQILPDKSKFGPIFWTTLTKI